MHENPTFPGLPHPEIDLVLNFRPVCVCQNHREEVAFSGMRAMKFRQVCDDAWKLFGQLPAFGIEEARITVEIVAELCVMWSSVLWETLGKAVVRKRHVD